MRRDLDSLRRRLEEAEATLNAIRGGDVDALVVSGANGEEIRAIQEMGGLADFVFDHVQQGIFILDGAGRILKANGRARMLCRGEPETRNFLEAVPVTAAATIGSDAGEEAPILPGEWPRVGPRCFGLEVMHKGDGGDECYYLLEASSIDLKDEGFRGGMITMTDITARKRADMQLAERNRQILYHLQLTLSITENTAEALLLTDAQGRVVLHNPAAERLFALAAEDITGKPMRDLFRLESGRESAQPRSSVPDFSRPGRIENGSARIPAGKDGGEILAEFSLTPVYEGGKWTGSVLMIRDVSVLRKVEEALRASEEKQRHSQKMEAVGRLAGGIAHDFNNLLLAILGFTELSLATLAEQDPVYDNLREVKKAGERAAALTSQLLAYSRKQVMTPKTVRLGSIVADMEKLLRRVIGEHIVLTTSVSGHDPWVRVDPSQIQQVLLNLVLNSRDAMPTGGRLSIAVFRNERTAFGTEGIIPGLLKEGEDTLPPGRFAVIEVRDTGHGMDEYVKSRLFEPFFTTKEFGKGSGLGLSTAFGIIKQSSGFVQVFSEPGHGAMFRLLLPDLGDIEEEWESAEAPTASAARHSETILLVEDEEAVISLLKTVLVRAGYHVLSAASAEEALILARESVRGLNLLVTDVIMDGMRGPELWEIIKPLHPEADVIFISGYSEDHVLGTGPSPFGNRFLPKPFTPGALLEKIRNILDAGIRDRLNRGTPEIRKSSPPLQEFQMRKQGPD